MSEQNPYAPVGAPTMMPSGPGVLAPYGSPPPPPPGYAPAPQHGYDNPNMTLTELSFAPIPTDVEPAPVEPPPSAGPGLVTNVLPSGGVARKLSVGGRTPLLALLLVLLLGAAAAVYSTGILKNEDEVPPPVVKRRPAVTAPAASAPAAPTTAPAAVPAKPKAVVKAPAVKPLVGKPASVTKANSRTYGGNYSVLVPTGAWAARLNNGRSSGNNADLVIGHDSAKQAFSVNSARPTAVKGPLTPAKVAALKAGLLKSQKAAKALPGEVTATVAGAKAVGFDSQLTASDGSRIAMRNLMFEHGGVVYLASWATTPAQFTKSLTTFNQLLATVKFAK